MDHLAKCTTEASRAARGTQTLDVYNSEGLRFFSHRAYEIAQRRASHRELLLSPLTTTTTTSTSSSKGSCDSPTSSRLAGDMGTRSALDA